jgi:uncharacterized protein DUF2628
MPTFTVHQPPPKKGETESAPERFVFLRDGFHVWAFLLTPLWLLCYRLWLAFVIYVVVSMLLGVALFFVSAPASVQWLSGILIALLVGFEAASIRRRKLAWRGWKTLGFVVGEDMEVAEQRFFAQWAKRAETPVVPTTPEPTYSAPVRRGPPSGSDVIGLFPEPGGGR